MSRARTRDQAEVLQDIAESTGKAANHRLKTVNEAAAEDEAAEATLKPTL